MRVFTLVLGLLPAFALFSSVSSAGRPTREELARHHEGFARQHGHHQDSHMSPDVGNLLASSTAESETDHAPTPYESAHLETSASHVLGTASSYAMNTTSTSTSTSTGTTTLTIARTTTKSVASPISSEDTSEDSWAASNDPILNDSTASSSFPGENSATTLREAGTTLPSEVSTEKSQTKATIVFPLSATTSPAVETDSGLEPTTTSKSLKSFTTCHNATGFVTKTTSQHGSTADADAMGGLESKSTLSGVQPTTSPCDMTSTSSDFPRTSASIQMVTASSGFFNLTTFATSTRTRSVSTITSLGGEDDGQGGNLPKEPKKPSMEPPPMHRGPGVPVGGNNDSSLPLKRRVEALLNGLHI